MSTFTIKYAGGFDAPWFVFEGSPSEIKAQLIEAFDLDPAEAEELSTHEVGLKATVLAQATAAASLSLAAVPQGRSGGWPNKSDKKWTKGGSKSSEGSSAQAEEPKKPEHPFQAVLDGIAGASSTEELTRIWVTAGAGQQDADVLKAFKAKGKALQ